MFLYHGLNGSRRIESGKWLKADIKDVRDGTNGTVYLSGFHVFRGEAIARDYMRKFTKPHKAIIVVRCRGLRKKEHSPDWVYLADQMKVIAGDK